MKYRPCEHVDWKLFDDESVVLDLSSGYYFRLNRVATFIWPLLDGCHGLTDIVNKVVDRFAVSQRQAKRDVGDFIRQLLAENLIQKA